MNDEERYVDNLVNLAVKAIEEDPRCAETVIALVGKTSAITMLIACLDSLESWPGDVRSFITAHRREVEEAQRKSMGLLSTYEKKHGHGTLN